MAEGVELWRRTVRRLTWAAVAANGLGALLMFLLLGFLFPFAPAGSERQPLLNGIVGAIYLPAALAIGTAIARRRGSKIERWIEEGRPPTPRERRYVLDEPIQTVVIAGSFWVLAAVLFTAINLPDAGWSALIVGGAMLLAGETTCAVAYLLSERIVRPITVLALAGSAAPERCGPGVAGRLAMAWSLGTGIPLLGILVMATAGLVDPDEDPALLAATIAFPGGRRAAGRPARDHGRIALGRRPDRRRAPAPWRVSRRATTTPGCLSTTAARSGCSRPASTDGGRPRGARAPARPVRPPRGPRGGGARRSSATARSSWAASCARWRRCSSTWSARPGWRCAGRRTGWSSC